MIVVYAKKRKLRLRGETNFPRIYIHIKMFKFKKRKEQKPEGPLSPILYSNKKKDLKLFKTLKVGKFNIIEKVSFIT